MGVTPHQQFEYGICSAIRTWVDHETTAEPISYLCCLSIQFCVYCDSALHLEKTLAGVDTRSSPFSRFDLTSCSFQNASSIDQSQHRKKFPFFHFSDLVWRSQESSLWIRALQEIASLPTTKICRLDCADPISVSEKRVMLSGVV